MALRDMFRRLLGGIQAKSQTFYPRDEMYLNGGLPRATYNYQRDVKEGLDSNVIMAPMTWIMRNFTEAPAVVESRRGQEDRVWDIKPGHRGEELLANPNPFYDGDAMFKALLISYVFDGNAYLLKVRNRIGEPLELWYAPHWTVRPRWPDNDPTVFISHYEYSTGGQTFRIPPRDIVHLRWGLDPRNPRLGYGHLRPLYREIWSDDEAASFSATILQNQGVPGILVAPEVVGQTWTKEQADEVKAAIDQSTSGGNRGGSWVMRVAMKLTQFGFDPNKLMLPNLRDISEERVCAMLGIPAAVVGFGSGLQSTKVGATMRELRKMAWNACITPMQTSIARQLTRQLMPDLVSQVNQFRFGFDVTEVSAFEEDANLMAQRVCLMVEKGILRVDRAQAMLGLEVDPTRAIYLQPSGAQPIDEQGKPVEMPGAEPNEPEDEEDDDDEVPEATASRMNGNGNGRDDE